MDKKLAMSFSLKRAIRGVIPIIAVVGVFFLCSCDDSANTTPKKKEQNAVVTQQQTPINVELTCSVEQNAGRVSIIGKTNLPPNTNLMFSIEDKSTETCFGQSKGEIQADGTFKSELLGPLSGLSDGLYVASVTMPVPSVQPENVQAVIGKNGENLSGKLLNKKYGTVTINIEQNFSIGQNPQKAQQEKEKKRISENAKIKQSLCQHLSSLLKFKETQDFKHYGFGRGGKYYSWLESITKIRDQISKNDTIDYDVRVAAGQILQVGMDYVNHPEGTSFIKTCLPEIKQAINFKE